MYHEVGIQKLSENQLSKLRNGHPVRIKAGNHHKICLSVQQLKKLHKAGKKGSATTITFDPYQLEAHGSGILGDIGKKAKQFIQKYKLQNIVNPVIDRVKKESHKGVSKLSNYAHSKINELQPIEQGEGFIDNMGREVLNYMFPYKGGGPIGDVLGMVGNVGGPIGTAANVGSTIAKVFGLGARKHTSALSKKPRKSRKQSGKGFVADLAKTGAKEIAKKGIEFGADYLKNKVSGMGNKRFTKIRRVVGRKAPSGKKTFGGSGCGGALYPAGTYGGAMYC